MKYACFPINSEQEINEFFETHDDRIIRSSTDSGVVAIVYHEKSPEELRLEAMIQSVDEFINNRYAEMLGKTVDELYHGELHEVNKKEESAKAAAESRAHKMNLQKQIKLARGLREQLVNRTWDGLEQTGMTFSQ